MSRAVPGQTGSDLNDIINIFVITHFACYTFSGVRYHAYPTDRPGIYHQGTSGMNPLNS